MAIQGQSSWALNPADQKSTGHFSNCPWTSYTRPPLSCTMTLHVSIEIRRPRGFWLTTRRDFIRDRYVGLRVYRKNGKLCLARRFINSVPRNGSVYDEVCHDVENELGYWIAIFACSWNMFIDFVFASRMRSQFFLLFIKRIFLRSCQSVDVY